MSDVVVLGIDADGCLYNFRYSYFLLQIIDKHWDFILEYGNKTNLGEETSFVNKKIQEILAEIANFDTNESISRDQFSKFIKNKKFRDKINEIKTFFNNKNLNPPFHKILGMIFRQFIMFLNKMDPEILVALFLHANKPLFDFIFTKFKKEGVKKYAVVIMSNRQSYYLDTLAREENGTDSIFINAADFDYHIKNTLCAQIEKSVIGKLLTSDAFGNLSRGESRERILEELDYQKTKPKGAKHFLHEHARGIFDHTKLLPLYLMMHDVTNILKELEAPEDADVEFVVLDDLEEIYNAWKKANEQYQENFNSLFPSNVQVTGLHYNGILNEEPLFTCKGSGVTDLRSFRNTRLMADLCRIDHHASIKAAQELNFLKFLEQRVTGWEIIPYVQNPFSLFHLSPSSQEKEEVKVEHLQQYSPT